MWRALASRAASKSRGSRRSFTPLKVTKLRLDWVESAAVMAGGSSWRRRFVAPTSSADQAARASLKALTSSVVSPSRAAATPVMTAPPPSVWTKELVLTSSPARGSRSRPRKIRVFEGLAHREQIDPGHAATR